MNDTALEAVLRRDRVVVASVLVLIAALSWIYVLWLAAGMQPTPGASGMPGMEMSGSMDMPGMDMPGMDISAAAPMFRPWMLTDFAFIFAMWAIMMIGMMTPSVAPMILLYARVGRNARAGGKPFAATGWFFAGYLAVWITFGVAATAAQWLLTSYALLNPMMATPGQAAGGLILVAAGLYQWTPLKDVCLRQCQAPLAFLTRHGGFQSRASGALRLGVLHGAYCLGCCWALMALLFVGGVMNVLWIAALAILVLLEKTVPAGRWIPRISGALMTGAGIWLLARMV